MEGREVNQGKIIVHYVIDHLKGNSWNITTNNYFFRTRAATNELETCRNTSGKLKSDSERNIAIDHLGSISTAFGYPLNIILASYVPFQSPPPWRSRQSHCPPSWQPGFDSTLGLERGPFNLVRTTE